MKIIHTADWHLGQKFLYNDRESEHARALEWLKELIITEEVEALIVAGDIFDIGSPPNYAQSLYYNFLVSLQNTGCRHIVIVGGNHDSPSMLNAPKDVLRALNIHVIGAITDNPEDQILKLRDRDGNLEAVVAAVPFLRDRDLRTSIAGEGAIERTERIKQGIYKHYQDIAAQVKPYARQEIPIITTGHLYAKGAIASDKQDNIYIGNMENIEADDFPPIFNYVALGHLHKAQVVGQQYHIRYSGSIIPLSFSEVEDDKSVTLLHFEGKKMKEGIKEIPVPTFRKLLTINGDLESVQKKLDKINRNIKPDELKAWIEVIIDTEQLIPNLDGLLQEYIKDMNLELLKIRTNRQHFALDTQTKQLNLDELKPIEVFQKKCESFGSPPEEMKELLDTFRELENWIDEKEER
ncbi:MAG: exonuclease SbcD [Saprospiraceae bacterium]|jgi:exonuclease SbcD